jgi:hypothetical protein
MFFQGLREDETFSYFIIGLVGGFLIAYCVASLIGSFFPTYEKIETIKLYSLEDNIGMSSRRFFLGTGRIENNDYYYFRKEVGDGLVQKDRIVVDFNNNIVFEDESAPHGEAYLFIYSRDFVRESSYYWGVRRYKVLKYVFQIPPGSIKKGYLLDQ